MLAKNTADHGLVRELNLSLVLRLIYSQAPLSRAQLALKTGLNKSTVSSLVEDLLSRRLIHETGTNSMGTGRPATLLEINPQAGCIVGVELGVDYIASMLINFVGEILWHKQVNTDPTESPEKTLDAVLALIREVMAVSHEPILGLSFSIPGTVDLDAGVVIFAPNLGWHNVPMRDIFSQATGLKVFIENDANAAALAEHLFGAAQHLRDFIFVFCGVGLGGGLFLNGQLYRGKGGYAGEIGHTAILAEPLQRACHCGQLGCWETYANQYSIIQRVQSRLESGSSSLIRTLMIEQNQPLSLAVIKQAADFGDQYVLEALAEAGTAMGIGLVALVNIFNPEKIILGGPVSVVEEYLLPSIRESVSQRAMPEIAVQTDIGISTFGLEASLIGTAAVVVDDVLKNPTHVERR